MTYGDRAEEGIKVVEPLYRTSSMARFIILLTAFTLVNIRLLAPSVISPVKVVVFWVA